MMFKNLFRRKTKCEPDIEKFLDDLQLAVAGKDMSPHEIAAAFRHLFTRNDPQLGRIVLHVLLTWCGEYEAEMPESSEALQRLAGKREIALRIKTAMYADLRLE